MEWVILICCLISIGTSFYLGEQLDGCTKHLSSKISILYERILDLEQSNRRLEAELSLLTEPHRERERLMRELD